MKGIPDQAALADRAFLARPSSAARIVACPASLRLAEKLGIPDESPRDYTSRGDFGHLLVSQMLDGEKIDRTDERFDEEILDAAMKCYEFAEEIRSKSHWSTWETRYEHPFIDGCGGTTDFAAYYLEDRKMVLHIVDWKFGEGVYVDAFMNWQLILYALLVTRFKDSDVDGEATAALDITFRVTVIQPLLGDDEPSTHEYTWEELLDLERHFEDRLFDSDYSIGDHCQFCNVRTNCPMMQELAEEANNSIAFGADKATIDRLAWCLRFKKHIVKYLDECIERLERHMVERGNEVDGLKIVRKKKGRRSWRALDPEALAEELVALGIPREQLFELKTPAKIEKEQKITLGQHLPDFIHQAEGGLTVALASDNRPAVATTSDPAEDFKEFLNVEE